MSNEATRGARKPERTLVTGDLFTWLCLATTLHSGSVRPARIGRRRTSFGGIRQRLRSQWRSTALRHQRILEIGPDNTVAAESEQDYAAWKTAREDLLSEALQPSISVQTVTALARARASQHPEARPPIQSRPSSGATVGAADWPTFSELSVHSMLATVDLDADAVQFRRRPRSREASNTNDLSISSTVCTRQ